MLGGFSLLFFLVPDFWLALLILVGFASWTASFRLAGCTTPSSTTTWHDGAISRSRKASDSARAHTYASLLPDNRAASEGCAARRPSLRIHHDSASKRSGRARSHQSRHALRNALLPIITLIGVAFPHFSRVRYSWRRFFLAGDGPGDRQFDSRRRSSAAHQLDNLRKRIRRRGKHFRGRFYRHWIHACAMNSDIR